MDDVLYNIDKLYEHVLHFITKKGEVSSFSQKLLKLDSEAQKVEMVYNLLKDNNLFAKKIDIQKSAEKSTLLRNIGNDYFKKRNDKSALKNYNQAVCYAPNLSRELSLAFANRSAVNFTFKNYRECISDIENALEIGYDVNLKPKLLKRKAMCEDAIAVLDETDNIEIQCKRQFRLSKERNPLIPCAANNIEIAYSERMGRSIVATDDIKAGDVVVTEQPYCNVLLEPFYLQNCYECFKKSDALLPCEHCCIVMFCSDRCRKSCWGRFHKMECPIMPLLVAMKFSKLELLAIRTVIQAKCTLSSWEKLIATIDAAESEINPLYQGFSRKIDSDGNETLLFDSLSYTPIHTLVTNIEKRSISDVFQKSVTAAVFLHFLMEYTDFFSDCVDNSRDDVNNVIIDRNKCIKLTGGLLLHHNMTGPSNMHSIGALMEDGEKNFVENVNWGGGAYAFLSLFNHSCAQSVVRYCNGTTVSLVALRPIKKGEQLFDNYGFHHAIHSLKERRESLLFQYKFQCMCEACVDNWPMYVNLPRALVTDKKKARFIAEKVLTDDLINSLKTGNRRVALSTVDQLYPHVTILEEFAPNVELAEYQETIKQCWSLFGNIIKMK